jgi:hypothetical protein
MTFRESPARKSRMEEISTSGSGRATAQQWAEATRQWCFYGWRAGAAHQFFGPANIPDVWSVKKVNPQSMVHLTEKPVELAERAIEYSSRPGENVLDLFGGSGSTLIAAEQSGRRAFLMEIDALYCDVIVQRWERFTGKKAQRFGATGRRDSRRGRRASKR